MQRLQAGVVMALLLVGPVSASEVYEISDPMDRQEVAYSPPYVRIQFTEPVDFLRAELFDQDQRRFEVRFGRPEDEAMAISVRIVDVLPPGRYRLSWVAFVPTHRHSDDGNILFTVLPRPPG